MMTVPQIGTLISVCGYALAIGGGFKLYRNVPPDRPFGSMPRVSSSGGFEEHQRNEDAAIASRGRHTRIGFLFVTLGSCAQLVGTFIAGFL